MTAGRISLYLAAALATLYLSMLLALFLLQRSLLFPAPCDASAAPLAGFSAVQLDTEDGLRLAAAWRAGSGARPTILSFHGNGDSLTGAEAATRAITQAGYGVLLVEYRGYAGNPGGPSEQGPYRDGRAALAWLEGRGVVSRCVVLIGNPLGSGVATEIAAGASVAGLVLVSGFTSMPDVVAPPYPCPPVRMLLRDSFDNRTKIARATIPDSPLRGTATG
ncbi:alpha/beta hydrolase [Sphingomonas sp. HF-S4]|uniref:Alpha/beta hydrolase n=1 Tax=Sphingomonas agrestis TaxID=3080540 RepID=A0ABU3YAB3_9SPHN|nr:alpha/beta hydrolase [Sphingomonas sp. HF-S4]MDV3458320.1 alpha/beta hydrolase [Sphingomonas sp. HF-S4]